MRAVQNPFMNDDSIMMECASKIAGHLERNIVKYRSNPEIANRMSAMNKYIQVNYMLSGACSLFNRVLSA